MNPITARILATEHIRDLRAQAAASSLARCARRGRRHLLASAVRSRAGLRPCPEAVHARGV